MDMESANTGTGPSWCLVQHSSHDDDDDDGVDGGSYADDGGSGDGNHHHPAQERPGWTHNSVGYNLEA